MSVGKDQIPITDRRWRGNLVERLVIVIYV